MVVVELLSENDWTTASSAIAYAGGCTEDGMTSNHLSFFVIDPFPITLIMVRCRIRRTEISQRSGCNETYRARRGYSES